MRLRTALAVVAILAAGGAQAALAHVTVVPPFASAGAEVRLVLDVPNERRTETMSSLEVTVPPGMRILAGERLGAWHASVDGRDVRWVGGSLAPRLTARFALVVVAPPRSGALVLQAMQGYPDGGRVPWRVDLTITPAAGDGDGAEQHLGAAALAGVVGLGVIGGSLLLLHRLRRRPLQDR